MKNIKNTLAAVGLAAVLGVGSVSVNAGTVKSDTSVKAASGQCSVKNNSVFGQFLGFINTFTGINIFDAPCNANDDIDGYRKNKSQEIQMDGYRKC